MLNGSVITYLFLVLATKLKVGKPVLCYFVFKTQHVFHHEGTGIRTSRKGVTI